VSLAQLEVLLLAPAFLVVMLTKGKIAQPIMLRNRRSLLKAQK
jgi:hypothetical protein